MDGLFQLRAFGWKVAVVTNGTADNQLGKTQRTGLAEAVDAYALSGLEGIRKPDVGLLGFYSRCFGRPTATQEDNFRNPIRDKLAHTCAFFRIFNSDQLHYLNYRFISGGQWGCPAR
ncbi:hypothetical protein [Streptosporangium sp. NPDC002607]